MKKRLKYAFYFLKHKVSLFPCCSQEQPSCSKRHQSECEDCNQGKHGKCPLIRWKEFQSRLPTEAEIRSWLRRWPKCNWALVSGDISNLFALDFDGPEGEKTLRELLANKEFRIFYNNTAFVKTGGGYQIYAGRLPDGLHATIGTKIHSGCDYRFNRGYVIAPGSLHFSGKLYRAWRLDKLGKLPSFPQCVKELFTTSEVSKGSKPEIQESWVTEALEGVAKGERNDTCSRLAGHFISKGLPLEEVLLIMQNWNLRNSPPLPEEEVESVVRSIWSTHQANQSSSKQSAVVNSQTPEAAPWPQPIAPEGFHGLAGEFVRLIESQSESDPTALLIQFLGAFGSIIGRGAHFRAESDLHFTNLFAVLVGETSKGRKGVSWSHVRCIFNKVDRLWGIRNGLVSGEGLIWAVRDPITKTKKIKDSSQKKTLVQIVDEQTPIVVDEGVRDKRLFVQEPEFASILVVMGRDGNILSPTIRQAWETGDLQTLAKNSQAKATNAHISIIGHITREELRRCLNKTEAGNGFGNRFIWFCSRRSKILPEGGHIAEADLKPLIKQLQKAVDFAKRTDLLTRDEEARQLWIEIYPALSEGKPGLFGAVTSRAEAQTMRLASIFALLDCSAVIRKEHLQAALAIWKYAEESARHIFGNSTGDPIADQIYGFLKTSPNGKTKTEIHDIFNRNVPAQRIEPALLLLESSKMARRTTNAQTGGRPEERWFA